MFRDDMLPVKQGHQPWSDPCSKSFTDQRKRNRIVLVVAHDMPVTIHLGVFPHHISKRRCGKIPHHRCFFLIEPLTPGSAIRAGKTTVDVLQPDSDLLIKIIQTVKRHSIEIAHDLGVGNLHSTLNSCLILRAGRPCRHDCHLVVISQFLILGQHQTIRGMLLRAIRRCWCIIRHHNRWHFP
ncbi:Uncharacterised protein [Chlamydia trachomatis]|nr:Uncharacterised protein [Chlamydia trachomatis]